MAVISADVLKKQLSEGKLTKNGTFSLQEGDIITPSAREVLTENHIKLTEKSDTFQTIYGIPVSEKPEQMTHLHSNFLVPKNHPRILFRGKLDSLESKIILAQICAKEENLPKIVPDLEEIISFIRMMIRCEVKEEPLPEISLQGLDEATLHDHSHHPSKYYGMRHFLPTQEHGKMVCVLNRLRTYTREVEICAYNAFEDNYHKLTRTDIIMALNRLSSLFWIMMFKVLTDKYN